MTKTVMYYRREHNAYEGEGFIVRRYYGSVPVDGVEIPLCGEWALIDDEDVVIDADGFASDLAERNNLEFNYGVRSVVAAPPPKSAEPFPEQRELVSTGNKRCNWP